jgi:hypothetical protein
MWEAAEVLPRPRMPVWQVFFEQASQADTTVRAARLDPAAEMPPAVLPAGQMDDIVISQ